MHIFLIEPHPFGYYLQSLGAAVVSSLRHCFPVYLNTHGPGDFVGGHDQFGKRLFEQFGVIVRIADYFVIIHFVKFYRAHIVQLHEHEGTINGIIRYFIAAGIVARWIHHCAGYSNNVVLVYFSTGKVSNSYELADGVGDDLIRVHINTNERMIRFNTIRRSCCSYQITMYPLPVVLALSAKKYFSHCLSANLLIINGKSSPSDSYRYSINRQGLSVVV